MRTLPLASILLLWAHLLSAQDPIVAVEYYLDHDPGPGQGVAVPVTAEEEVDIDFTVSLADIAPGQHVLFVRVREEGGDWSLAFSRPILVEAASILDQAPELAEIEYFLDSDPGEGAATTAAVAGQFLVDLGELPDGLHTLFLRARDARGRWGITTAKPILVETVTARDPAPNVVGFEYYLDDDPGFGAGTEIQSVGGDATLFTVDLAAVGEGLHTVHVRPRDARGQWGLGMARPILVQSAAVAADAQPTLSRMEYFFDTDPGFGAGTEVGEEGMTGSPFQIDVGSAEPGLRTLYLRVRDERGRWSIPMSKPVFVDARSASDAVPEIVAIEHYLAATDGSGRSPSLTFSAFPAAAAVSLDFDIDLGGSPGEQILVSAARDSQGRLGMSVTHPLSVADDGGSQVDLHELEPRASDGTATLDFALVPGDQGVRRLTGAQPGQEVNARVVLQREFIEFQQVAVVIAYDPALLTPTTSRTIGLFSGAFTLAPLSQDGRASFGGALLAGEPRSGRGEVLEVGFTLSSSFTGSALLELVKLTIGPSLEELQTFNPGAAVVVTTGTTIPGDMNGDGRVDFADLFIFAGGYGGTDPAFDLDGSGEVDLGDFFILADNFGTSIAD